MSSIREVNEGKQIQGVDESIIYTLTTTNWGSDPSSVSMVVKDRSDSDADVTGTVSTGSPTASGDVITLPAIESLTENRVYRVEVKFTSGSSVWEPYFDIKAEL